MNEDLTETGIPLGNVTEEELERVVLACRSIPLIETEYVQEDYLTNVFLTVLDLQMHNVAVNNSILYYREHAWDEVRSLDNLQRLLDQHADDQEGNRSVAQHLWGNNHWVRVHWLRGLVKFLSENNLTSQEALRLWATEADFGRDFEGRVKHLGLAAFQWLSMRLGVETVKPDVHLRRFIERLVEHAVSDEEIVNIVKATASRLGISPRKLDWSLWEFQRGAPGSI